MTRDIPGVIPFCYGLKWSVKDEPGVVVLNARRLIQFMDEVNAEIAQEPTFDAFKDVPEENWKEYRALFGQYRALHAQVWPAAKKAEACWNEKVLPYLKKAKPFSD